MVTKAFLVGLVLLAEGLTAGSAHAQDAQSEEARDIRGWTPIGVNEPTEAVLEPAPDGYLNETRGGIEWTFPASATSVVRELQGQHAEAWDRVVDELGGPIDDRVVIRVGLNPEEMRALAPVGHPPPDYAAGVAYPRFGVILLTLQAPDSWQRPDVEKVLTHELSHIALYRAVGGEQLPRWFVEGVAIQQAQENDLGRIRTLWQAVVADNVVPLSDLDRHFPSYPHRVSVAYAQSADIIAHMRRGDSEARRFRSLLRKIREEDMSFEDSFFDSYEMSLATMEHEWRDQLDERFQTIPLVVTGGGLWVLASFLLVIAYIRRRRRHHRVLARWAEEEAATDEALERAEEAVLTELAMRRAAEGIDHVLIVNGEPPQGRESGVPTIQYDGNDHTLH